MACPDSPRQGMQQGLQGLAPLFSWAADERQPGETFKLLCSPTVDGKQFLLSAVDVLGSHYEQEFAEPDMAKMKPEEMTWVEFFNMVEAVFLSNSARVSLDNSLVLDFVENGVECEFVLPKVSDTKDRENNATHKFASRLFEAVKLRTDLKDGMKAIEEVTRKEGDLRRKLTALENERKILTSVIDLSEQEEKQVMEEYEKLQRDLSEYTEQYRQYCEKVGKDPDKLEEESPIDPDALGMVGRQPATELCADFDEKLLQLVKSRFCFSQTEGDPDIGTRELGEEDNWLKVIRPFAKNPWEMSMKMLPENERWYVMITMEKLNSWDYDVWTVQDMTGQSLFYTAYAIFMRWDLLRIFNVDEQVFLNFITQVQAGYNNCPYHNLMHAADVSHIFSYILAKGGARNKLKLSNEDVYAAMIAAVMHDYDHPGLNNNFHIKIQSYLANLYNDRSLLENHHLAEVFDMLKNPNFNILASLDESQRREVREIMIEMVMGTDMGLHAKMLGSWKRRLSMDDDLYKKRDDQRLALVMLLKMSDISNVSRPTPLYLKWAVKLLEEFYLQGDNEKNRGDVISPFMNRSSPSMGKSQVAFINYVVIPMYESIVQYLPDLKFVLDQVKENRHYWSINDDSLDGNGP